MIFIFGIVLIAWRQHETNRIKTTIEDEEEQKRQLNDLLHKEIKLLQTIDKLKIVAKQENDQENVKILLEKVKID